MSSEIKGINVVNLAEYKASKTQEKIILKSYETVELLAEKFKKLDSNKMIEELPDFLKRQDESRVGLIINAFANKYSGWNKETREKGLTKVLGYLDGLNDFDKSKILVATINDPVLIGDILANRKAFLPRVDGYHAYYDGDTFLEVKEAFENARSKFWFVFGIFENKSLSNEVKRKFYETFPSLIDKSLNTIAAMIDNNLVKVEEFDLSFIGKINEKIKEKKWIILKDKNIETQTESEFSSENVLLKEEENALKEVEFQFDKNSSYKNDLSIFVSELNLAAKIRNRIGEGGIGEDEGVLGEKTIEYICKKLAENKNGDGRRIKKIGDIYLRSLKVEKEEFF